MERDITILLLRLGLLAVVYFFLLQLLIIMWRDLRPVAPLASQPKPVAFLEIVDPAKSGKLAGDQYVLEPVTSLGRSPQNAIVLADASVSAEHALVFHRLGRWWVEDLGSTNGTSVNNVRVEQPTVISTGDVISVGAVRLRLQA